MIGFFFAKLFYMPVQGALNHFSQESTDCELLVGTVVVIYTGGCSLHSIISSM